MPDRAVVDEVPCAWCGGDGYVTGSMPCPECTPTPRALVALSEDGQWLVVTTIGVSEAVWIAMQQIGSGMTMRYEFRFILADDTGQDAHAVLAAFLAGRHDGR